MKVDEAIQKMREEAKRQRYNASFDKGGIYHQLCLCALQNAKEYDQIAEMLEHFKEYQQLEEQGRLMKLPCMVGSDIYAITFDYEKEQYEITKTKIIEVNQNYNGWFFRPLISIPAFKINDFGKSVFLVRDEAKEKLKELEWCATCHFKDDCEEKENFIVSSPNDSCEEYA